jgi:tetratricopeptide (TPR) repeat protein
MISTRQIYLITRDAAFDPERADFREAVARHRREGFGWRYDGLGDWDTDAIFQRLVQLGIESDADRFIALARSAPSCASVCQTWRDQLGHELDDFWDDFPFLASEELWRRLTPEQPCPEMVADRLEAAIARDHQRSESPEEDLAAALALAEYLERGSPGERVAMYERVKECGLHHYDDWIANQVRRCAAAHPQAAERVGNVVSDADPLNARWLQADLAEGMAEAGRAEDALRISLSNLARFGRNFWTVVRHGDVYEALNDPDTAIMYWTEGLSLALEEEDWDTAAERIQSRLQQSGRTGEWQAIEKAHPRRRPIPLLPTPLVSPSAPVSSRPSGKIGRNDPCPCGSGRKYKKCCLQSGGY